MCKALSEHLFIFSESTQRATVDNVDGTKFLHIPIECLSQSMIASMPNSLQKLIRLDEGLLDVKEIINESKGEAVASLVVRK